MYDASSFWHESNLKYESVYIYLPKDNTSMDSEAYFFT